MLEAALEQIRSLLGLGLDIEDVGAVQMVLRTVIIYALTLAVVRLGSARVMGKSSAFDDVVAIMLGSVMSRAINGSAPFVPTVVSGGMLLGMHWLFAMLAYRTSWFGAIVKGGRTLLIENGKVEPKGMRRARITDADLAQALRHTGKTDPSNIRLAYLERNGDVSVVPEKREPHVVDVSVADGVQTVRIELA